MVSEEQVNAALAIIEEWKREKKQPSQLQSTQQRQQPDPRPSDVQEFKKLMETGKSRVMPIDGSGQEQRREKGIDLKSHMLAQDTLDIANDRFDDIDNRITGIERDIKTLSNNQKYLADIISRSGTLSPVDDSPRPIQISSRGNVPEEPPKTMRKRAKLLDKLFGKPGK